MKSLFQIRTAAFFLAGSLALVGLGGCASDGPASAASGPGVENPLSSTPNSVMPTVGGPSGNGGGISGGGAGAGVGR